MGVQQLETHTAHETDSQHSMLSQFEVIPNVSKSYFTTATRLFARRNFALFATLFLILFPILTAYAQIDSPAYARLGGNNSSNGGTQFPSPSASSLVYPLTDTGGRNSIPVIAHTGRVVVTGSAGVDGYLRDSFGIWQKWRTTNFNAASDYPPAMGTNNQNAALFFESSAYGGKGIGATDVETGTSLWQNNESQDQPFGSPLISETSGKIYCVGKRTSSGNGLAKIYCYENGLKKWTWPDSGSAEGMNVVNCEWKQANLKTGNKIILVGSVKLVKLPFQPYNPIYAQTIRVIMLEDQGSAGNKLSQFDFPFCYQGQFGNGDSRPRKWYRAIGDPCLDAEANSVIIPYELDSTDASGQNLHKLSGLARLDLGGNSVLWPMSNDEPMINGEIPDPPKSPDSKYIDTYDVNATMAFSPAVTFQVQGVFCAGPGLDTLVRRKLGSGELEWSKGIPNGKGGRMPVIDVDKGIWIGTDGGSLLCFDAQSGILKHPAQILYDPISGDKTSINGGAVALSPSGEIFLTTTTVCNSRTVLWGPKSNSEFVENSFIRAVWTQDYTVSPPTIAVSKFGEAVAGPTKLHIVFKVPANTLGTTSITLNYAHVHELQGHYADVSLDVSSVYFSTNPMVGDPTGPDYRYADVPWPTNQELPTGFHNGLHSVQAEISYSTSTDCNSSSGGSGGGGTGVNSLAPTAGGTGFAKTFTLYSLFDVRNIVFGVTGSATDNTADLAAAVYILNDDGTQSPKPSPILWNPVKANRLDNVFFCNVSVTSKEKATRNFTFTVFDSNQTAIYSRTYPQNVIIGTYSFSPQWYGNHSNTDPNNDILPKGVYFYTLTVSSPPIQADSTDAETSTTLQSKTVLNAKTTLISLDAKDAVFKITYRLNIKSQKMVFDLYNPNTRFIKSLTPIPTIPTDLDSANTHDATIKIARNDLDAGGKYTIVVSALDNGLTGDKGHRSRWALPCTLSFALNPIALTEPGNADGIPYYLGKHEKTSDSIVLPVPSFDPGCSILIKGVVPNTPTNPLLIYTYEKQSRYKKQDGTTAWKTVPGTIPGLEEQPILALGAGKVTSETKAPTSDGTGIEFKLIWEQLLTRTLSPTDPNDTTDRVGEEAWMLRAYTLGDTLVEGREIGSRIKIFSMARPMKKDKAPDIISDYSLARIFPGRAETWALNTAGEKIYVYIQPSSAPYPHLAVDYGSNLNFASVAGTDLFASESGILLTGDPFTLINDGRAFTEAEANRISDVITSDIGANTGRKKDQYFAYFSSGTVDNSNILGTQRKIKHALVRTALKADETYLSGIIQSVFVHCDPNISTPTDGSKIDISTLIGKVGSFDIDNKDLLLARGYYLYTNASVDVYFKDDLNEDKTVKNTAVSKGSVIIASLAFPSLGGPHLHFEVRFNDHLSLVPYQRGQQNPHLYLGVKPGNKL